MRDFMLTENQIKDYIKHLQDEERAHATVEKYQHDIGDFAAWLEGRVVSKELVTQWKETLLEGGLRPATVNSKLSAVNGLLRYLGWAELQVKLLKLQHKPFRDTARALTQVEFKRLVDAAGKQGRYRLELLLETICSAGLRVSEVQYITVEAAGAGQAEIRLKGKIRTILLPGKLCRKLLKYAQKQKISSGSIFRTKDGKAMSRFQIWREMKSLCAMAGVESSKVFPHNLRHLFAVTFYKATRDIVKLADVLGHSSINTTRIYLLTTGTEHAHLLEQLGIVS